MTKLQQFLKSLVPAIESGHDRDEAYLAEAVDIYDLERRMRDIDERAFRRSPGFALRLERG